MTLEIQFKDLYEKEKLKEKFWSFEEVEKSLLREDTDVILLAEDERLFGFLLYQHSFDESELYFIYIFEGFRGKKKSRELMSSYISLLNKKAVRRIYLEVRETNIVAQNLYKAYGFKILAKREKYYKDGETALIFEKVLCEK